MRLLKSEQETIINFNEEVEKADVYTHDQRLITKLKKIAGEYPEECVILGENAYGAWKFLVSKRLIGIHMPRSKAWREQMRNLAKAGEWNPKTEKD